MIIQCINCNKKFEVNSSLIPNEGRNIQCGSCNHTWFYKNNTKISPNDIPAANKQNEHTQINITKTKINNANNEEDQSENDIIINDNPEENNEYTNQIQVEKSYNFSIEKILSYFVVGIITFVALIIILDTFETSLNNKFPSLELILYNLFETIKDITLFIKNLLI